MRYGICTKDGKWGEAPKEFDERKHFMVCTCGSVMYMTHQDPKGAGYRDADKMTPNFVEQ
jgi:hypothetical protein